MNDLEKQIIELLKEYNINCYNIPYDLPPDKYTQAYDMVRQDMAEKIINACAEEHFKRQDIDPE